MTLEELNQIISALIADGHFRLAAAARGERDAREIARDAILDHVEAAW